MRRGALVGVWIERIVNATVQDTPEPLELLLVFVNDISHMAVDTVVPAAR